MRTAYTHEVRVHIIEGDLVADSIRATASEHCDIKLLELAT